MRETFEYDRLQRETVQGFGFDGEEVEMQMIVGLLGELACSVSRKFRGGNADKIRSH